MKTVLVTGGATGIGEAISRLFANNGYNVVINYNKSDKQAIKLCSDLNRNGNVCAIKADITDEAQVGEMVKQTQKQFGTVDILIANAGVALEKCIQDCNEADYYNLFDTNVKGVFSVVNAVLPQMISNKGGKIIIISSIWGERGGSYEVLYSATKGALNSYAKALSREVGISNINVNCILPGLIDTSMNGDLTEQDKQRFIDKLSIQRIGTPLDIAGVALFLASEQANYITGQLINVDGGY